MYFSPSLSHKKKTDAQLRRFRWHVAGDALRSLDIICDFADTARGPKAASRGAEET